MAGAVLTILTGSREEAEGDCSRICGSMAEVRTDRFVKPGVALLLQCGDALYFGEAAGCSNEGTQFVLHLSLDSRIQSLIALARSVNRALGTSPALP